MGEAKLIRTPTQEMPEAKLNMMGETKLNSRNKEKPTKLDSPPLYRWLLRGMLASMQEIPVNQF